MSTPERPADQTGAEAATREADQTGAEAATGEADQTGAEAATGEPDVAHEDDVRARFREALQAKQAAQPHLGGVPRTGPAQAHTAAARPTRRFRRKSG